MKETNDAFLSRRTVLRSLGGVAGTSAIAGVAAAKRDSLGSSERQQVLKSERVKRLYEEVGRPPIRSATKVQGRTARTTGTVYRFDTDLGELRYVLYGDHAAAQFVFATLDDGPGFIRTKYEKAFQVPSSLYTDETGGIAFVREVTADERAALADATGFDSNEAQMAYSTELEGFVVRTPGGTGGPRAKFVAPRSGATGSGTASAIGNGRVQDLDTVVTAGVSSQEACDDDACWTCVAGGVGGIVTCGGVCIVVSWTIVGIVLCVGCILAAGGYVGYNCMRCYETCG